MRKKILCIILLFILLANIFNSITSAATINKAEILNLGDCGYHLKYWDESRNLWSYIITTLVGYNYNGKTHYAYCLNRDAHGVGSVESYNVDIDSLLDNVQIWRTITAGFPYRTASQIGCSTNEDAFVATKQAVYCILYNFNPETRYRGADERGNQIKQAIINLVNEGKNGTRTPKSANITINKIGDLIKDGDYCYQELSISSFVNIKNFTVKCEKGLPNGYKFVNMYNKEQNEFEQNEHFKIAIPTDKIKNNINTTLSVDAKCETYPVFIGKAPSNNLQDYALTYDSLSNEHGNSNINIDVNKSSIKIIKEDSVKKYKIPGVEFNFKYSTGENIGNFTTDKNGEIFVDKLKPGNIIIKEIKTQKNYILNDKEIEIKLDYASSIVKTIENTPVDIKVNIEKNGNTEIKPGDNINYEFSNIVNNSNTYLDSFKWYDYIPTDYVKLETIQTGIWNQELSYNAYYKTNKSDKYILLKEGLKTTENTELDFKNLKLDSDEYITETMFDFGKVDIGFRENTSPIMQCKSFNTLKNGDIFTNHTKVIGTYFEITAESNSKCNTLVYAPKTTENILPKTGN